MQVEVGTVLEGKVTGITNFGAFVSLPGGKSGLVHISEVANTYVKDVRDYLSEGQSVRVKVLRVTPEGKINLSVKAAEPFPPAPPAERRRPPAGGSRAATPARRRDRLPRALPTLFLKISSSTSCGRRTVKCRAAVSMKTSERAPAGEGHNYQYCGGNHT